MSLFIRSTRRELANLKDTNSLESNSVPPPKKPWINYLIPIILTNTFIWTTAFIYITKAKTTYLSDWSINIAGLASNANINLPEIGQAISQDYSAYATASYDPRDNYKAIASSEQVLNTAATALNMSLKDFGEPRIKTVDNTTLMKFELKGSTPKEAQEKSRALYNALQLRLNQLRQEEIEQQNARLQKGIQVLQNKLKSSQQRLYKFKSSSGLYSNEQLTNLAINIETLRKQHAELMAQEQLNQGRASQLSTNLNLSSQQASDSFVLQADPVFQKYLQNYSDAKGKLINLNSKFSSVHPTIIAQKSELNLAEAGLVNRAESLLKRPFNTASIDKLNFTNNESSGSKRAVLSEQLVVASVDKQGLQAQIKALEQQITQLESRLKTLSQQQAVVEDLKRDVQVSEAVFSSTLVKLDLAKSSISASYPQIQVMSKPSLPDASTEPKKNLVLLGAALGSLLSTSGIIGLKLRER